MTTTNPVLFVGAGPGDADLITVKGQKALMQADLVIYAGSLVPEAVLQWTRAEAEVLNSASMVLEQIITLIKNAYNAGKKVVRLHTGDPCLYGAIFEQMTQLRKQSISYNIIPGVTAAFAAAAAMGIEFTIPEVSQTLILTRMAGRTPVPETEKLELLAKHRTSMVIYLSMSLIDRVETILKNEYGVRTGCAVVYRASQPDEKIIYTKIGQLAGVVKKEKITNHAVIVVGKVLDIKLETLKYRSKLYDRCFSHKYRNQQTNANN